MTSKTHSSGRRKLLLGAVTFLTGLAGLGSSPAIGQTSQDDLVFRRIWTSSAERSGSFFLGVPVDGRYVPTTAAAGDLGLFDLQTEEVERLTDKGSWDESVDYVGSAVASADGRRIAYQWAHFIDEEAGENQLRVIDRDGTGERVLVAQPMPFWIEPQAWTPDGTAIVAQRRVEGSGRWGDLELVLVSTDDGSTRVLERFESGSVGRLFVSPDGRYAAYDFIPEGSADADIYAVDLAGPSEMWRRPVSQSAMLVGIDGRRLYLGGEELTSIDLENRRLQWATPVPVGTSWVRPLVGTQRLYQFTPRGIFELDTATGDVMRKFRGADLDSLGGTILVTPKLLITVSNLAVTAYPIAAQENVSQLDPELSSLKPGKSR